METRSWRTRPGCWNKPFQESLWWSGLVTGLKRPANPKKKAKSSPKAKAKCPAELKDFEQFDGDGNPICWSYNLDGCKEEVKDGRCKKGLHPLQAQQSRLGNMPCEKTLTWCFRWPPQCSIFGRPNYLLEKLHWEPELLKSVSPFIFCVVRPIGVFVLVVCLVLCLCWVCCFWCFLCWFALALLYLDRGFLSMVPLFVITTTATIVMMSAAWDQKKGSSHEFTKFAKGFTRWVSPALWRSLTTFVWRKFLLRSRFTRCIVLTTNQTVFVFCCVCLYLNINFSNWTVMLFVRQRLRLKVWRRASTQTGTIQFLVACLLPLPWEAEWYADVCVVLAECRPPSAPIGVALESRRRLSPPPEESPCETDPNTPLPKKLLKCWVANSRLVVAPPKAKEASICDAETMSKYILKDCSEAHLPLSRMLPTPTPLTLSSVAKPARGEWGVNCTPNCKWEKEITVMSAMHQSP